MNYIINHSPIRKKIFKICFAISMLIATMIITTYHCGIYIEGGSIDAIEQYETETQSNDIYETSKETESVTEEYIDITEEQTEESTTEVETTEQVRENTLYYINENGWESYLDIAYQDYLYKMCIKYNVENYYALFIAQMYHESGFNSNIVSTTNDYGLMQINICNHKYLEEKFGFTDFLNPYVSIESGVYFMSQFLHKYNDVEKALVCYNRGESAVINGTYSTSYSQGVLNDMNFLVKLD